MWETPVEASIKALLFPDRPMNVSTEWALRCLRKASNEDFGTDVVAWVNWAKQTGHLPSDYEIHPGVLPSPKVDEKEDS